MPSSAIRTADDVIAFLTGQHEQIKSLFAQVKSTNGSERDDAFTQLRRLLAVHETAEEEIVHPRARRELPNGDEVVRDRLEEENEGKQALAELEKLDANSPEFDAKFAKFEQDVIAHAEAEERAEFSALRDALAPEQLERMRTAAAVAEKMAPTRPHAGVESASANALAGPFAAMLDRARDALTSKS